MNTGKFKAYDPPRHMSTKKYKKDLGDLGDEAMRIDGVDHKFREKCAECGKTVGSHFGADCKYKHSP